MKKGIIKKVILASLVGVMALGFTACGKKEDAYEKVQKSGKLVVGLSADYAPYEYHAIIDGKDKIVGFDVDLAQEIADSLGVKLEIQEMEFGALCEGVKNGKVDMAISGMTPDEERKKSVNFSKIYYSADQSFLIAAKDKDKIKTVDDLKNKKLGAQMGSVQADIAEGIEGADVKLLADVNTLILELKNGNIDSLIVEVPVANMAVETNPELYVPDEIIKDEEGGSAVAMPKDSPKLVDEVNKVIDKLISEGKIDEYVKKAVEEVQYKAE